MRDHINNSLFKLQLQLSHGNHFRTRQLLSFGLSTQSGTCMPFPPSASSLILRSEPTAKTTRSAVSTTHVY